jgi:hypothetical protein
VGQRGGALGRAQGRTDITLQGFVATLGNALGHHFQRADDTGQQIVEVVGDATGQLADRLHLLRLAQLFLGLGDVALKGLVLLVQALGIDLLVMHIGAGADPAQHLPSDRTHRYGT